MSLFRGGVVALSVLALAGIAGAGQAQDARTVPWSKAPTIEQWKAAQSAAAKVAGVDSSATLDCTFVVGGALTRCRVLSERPAGIGVGAAALSLVPYFESPPTGDKGPAPGGLVELTITFPNSMNGFSYSPGQPVIVRSPADKAFDAAFPAAAKAEKIPYGRGLVECDVGPRGGMDNCRVKEETPAGKGFGAAAVSVTSGIVVSQWTQQNQPVSRQLTFPFEFGKRPYDRKAADALYQKATQANKAERLDELAAYGRDFAARYPSDKRATTMLFTAAVKHTLKGESLKGIALYDELALIIPNSANIENNRCWERAVANVELHMAIASCKRSLSLLPSAGTYDSMGFAYLRIGEFDLAIDAFSSALYKEPSYAHARYGRGVAKLRKGDQAGGELDIQAAERLQTNVAATWAKVGITR